MKPSIFLLALFMASIYAPAVSDSVNISETEIIDISETDPTMVSVEITGCSGAGPFKHIVIQNIETGKTEKKYILFGGGASEVPNQKILSEAKEHLRKINLDGSNFKEKYTEVKNENGQLFLPDGLILLNDTLMYQDILFITLYDKNKNDYRLIWKEDFGLRNEPYACPNPEKIKEDMEFLNMKSYIRKALISKKSEQIILLVRNFYELGGSNQYEKVREASISSNIKDADWLNLYGYRFYKEKNYSKAKEFLAESLMVKPDHITALYNLACVYSLLDEKENSISCLKKLREFQLKGNKIATSCMKKAATDSDFDNVKNEKSFGKTLSLKLLE